MYYSDPPPRPSIVGRVSLALLLVGVLSLSSVGCLRLPPDLAGGDASIDQGDAGPPAPLAVVTIEVFDGRGEPWPSHATPRLPTVVVTFSASVEDTETVRLLGGEPDDALREDLTTSPLRVANLAREVPCDRRVEGSQVRLTPLSSLVPGQALTLSVAAWSRTRDGRALGEPRLEPLQVSAAATAGAGVLDSWPSDGASNVPAEVSWLAVRFDGAVEGALRLTDEDGLEARGETRPVGCVPIGWPSGSCLEFRPERPLLPGGRYVLALGPDVTDATGAPLDPWEAHLRVASEPDTVPPEVLPSTCALDATPLEGAGCLENDDGRVRVTFQTSEPVRAWLSAGERGDAAVAPRGEVSLELTGLLADTLLEATLSLVDLAGQRSVVQVTLQTTPELATVSIVEVRADPNGREPTQELVEVLNYGLVPVDLTGMALSDRADALGDVILSAPLLAPGERAILASDGLDPDDPEDDPVPPGVVLIRMGRSLASGGLTNAGEALYLRDADSHRLSGSPAIATGEGFCLVRRADAPPRAAGADAFVVGACTPGRAP